MSDELNTDTQVMWFDDFCAEGEQTNRYRFLSNFYIGDPIPLGGREYETGEHAFQAAKATNPADFVRVADAPGPAASKSWGRKVQLRPDWEEVKYDVMAAVVRAKFAPNRKEALMLLDTGDRLLTEGTYWGDQVWGVDLQREHRPGRNWLGTLLMARRAELRAYEKHGIAPDAGVFNLAFAESGLTG